MAQGPEWVPQLLAFQEQGLQRDDPAETTPISLSECLFFFDDSIL